MKNKVYEIRSENHSGTYYVIAENISDAGIKAEQIKHNENVYGFEVESVKLIGDLMEEE